MPVTYLELENFKSYAGKQRIGPFHEFTSVIGPNGSGKSNLMDAISFVLGVQSRDLRSSQMKDLIFRPPGDRADDEDNIGANATLIYKAEDSDEETRFSRSISSKGTGEYRVNGRVVTFANYEKALAKIGVLLRGRNFLVFQGDVESTTRKTPKELVQWFEEISSSAEFKQEYDDALANMQKAEEDVSAASMKQKGVWKKKRDLKSQKDEAEQFKALVESKAKLLTEFFLWQLYHIKADIEEKEELLDDLNADLEEANQSLEELAGKVRSTKKEASAARSVSTKLEKKRTDLVAQMDKVQPDIIKVEQQIKNLEKKIGAEKRKHAKMSKESDAKEETLKALEKEIEEYKETEQHLQQEYEDLKKEGEVSLTEEQEAEYERIREAAAVASAKPRNALNTANRRLESARAKAATLSDEVKELQVGKSEAKNRVKELTERKDKMEESIQKTKQDLQESKEELQSTLDAMKEDEQKKAAINTELDKINATLRDAKDVKRKNDHEARIEEAISALKRYFPGVKGRLVRLCQPTMKRYDLAVTVAGGKDMDAVVVDTKQTAFECINYLRDNQIGTATFLPLDSLQVPDEASTERIRTMLQQDSRFRLCCDVISCNDDVKKAVMYAVGNSVVCDNLDCARELCFGGRNRGSGEEARFKAVTLGGAVISKAGTMTGGISSDNKNRAGRWNDREVEKLGEKRDELETELAELEKADRGGSQSDRRTSRGGRASKIEELRNRVGNFTNRLQFTESDLKFTKNKLKEQVALISSITKQEQKASSNLRKIETEIGTLSGKVEEAILAVKEAEEEYYGPFREKTGLKDFHSYDEAIGKSREDFLKKRRTIREHLEKLKAQKQYEENRDFSDDIAKRAQSIKKMEKKLEDAEARESEFTNSIAELKAQVASIESELEDAKTTEKEHDDEVKKAQSNYKQGQNNAKSIGKTIDTEEANLEGLRAKLHETLQKARVEEAEIPLTDSSDQEGESSRSSRSRRRSGQDDDSEMQDSSLPMTQGTFISTHFSQHDDSRVMKDRNDTNRIDFSQLNKDLQKRVSDNKEKDLYRKFTDNIEKVTMQIEGMSPNMKAADAFDTVVEELEECNNDFNESKKNAKRATKDFEEIKRKRIEKFKSAYDHIANALTVIYKDMTKSSKHPLGGNAFLSLDDTEEPYNGGIKFTAMPPMKRYRDMEYLSGGEKTIAALALLFAIHSYRPAPFFVMDEVDAALDNVNVLKLCNYIRQRSKDFQCIVISLKDMFYEQSKSLVGICRNVPTNSSRTLTLDLTKFDNEEEEEAVTRSSSKRTRSSSTGPRKRISTGSTTQ